MAKAKDVMNANVVSICKDEDIHEAVRTMVLNNVTGLPVTDAKGTIAGVITERDVLSLVYDRPDSPGTVQDFMTPSVVCFDQDDDLDHVVEILRTNPFRRVPILDNGRLVGIVSRSDIIRYMRDLKHEDLALKDSILELVF